MQTVHCPHCDEAIGVGDGEGPRLECPACGTRFERPLRPPPYALANDQEADFGPSVGLPPGALPALMRGGLLQIVAGLLHLLAMMVVVLLVVLALDRPSVGPGGPPVLLLLVAGSAFMATSVFNVIAACFWAMAPTRGVSRALGVAVLCFALLVVWRGSDALFLEALDRPDDRARMAAVAAVLLDAVRMMVFAAYLAAVARDTGRKASHDRATLLACLLPLLLIGPVLLLALAGAAGMSGSGVALLCLVLLGGGWLGAVGWSLYVLYRLRVAWGRIGRLARED